MILKKPTDMMFFRDGLIVEGDLVDHGGARVAIARLRQFLARRGSIEFDSYLIVMPGGEVTF